MGLLVYHEGYPTEQILTGFISVAISGGLWLISANLTGLQLRTSVMHSAVPTTSW